VKQIFLTRNGSQFGPFSEEQIKGKLISGEVQPTDQAWHEGLDGWKPVGELTGVGFSSPPVLKDTPDHASTLPPVLSGSPTEIFPTSTQPTLEGGNQSLWKKKGILIGCLGVLAIFFGLLIIAAFIPDDDDPSTLLNQDVAEKTRQSSEKFEENEGAFSFINALELEVGQSFSVSKKTPLMPHHSPRDQLSAIQLMKQIPAGGGVTILEVYTGKTNPWYRVTAFGKNREIIGDGWVNSIVLLGPQNLKEIEVER
jgi:hypothetical protein